MRVKLVEITWHDSGWKGTWYVTGERYFVRQGPYWPQVHNCKWDALGISGGIHEEHCREVRGLAAWVRCAVRSLWP